MLWWLKKKKDNLCKGSGTILRHFRCSVNVSSLSFPDRCNTWGFEFSKRNRDIIPRNFPKPFFVHVSHRKSQKVGKYKYQPSKKTSLQSIISLILSSSCLSLFPWSSQVWVLFWISSCYYITGKLWYIKRNPHFPLQVITAHFPSGPWQG